MRRVCKRSIASRHDGIPAVLLPISPVGQAKCAVFAPPENRRALAPVVSCVRFRTVRRRRPSRSHQTKDHRVSKEWLPKASDIFQDCSRPTKGQDYANKSPLPKALAVAGQPYHCFLVSTENQARSDAAQAAYRTCWRNASRLAA